MKVYAPGKLILSGEHAVVYGEPALAMAVNRYVSASVVRNDRISKILFDLSDLAHRSHLSFDSLHYLKERIKRKYHRFISGDISIRDVLQKPFELAQFALGVFAEAFNLSLPHGVNIQVQSDIPMGCGMGSSAATILSVMQAVSSYLKVNLSQEALFQLALEAESVQHGHTSGLDLRVALQGGCLFVHDQQIEAREVPRMSLFLINTGAPSTTTGQCVEKVAPYFKTGMGSEFAAVTRTMDAALVQQSSVGMQQAIRENHVLLNKIGVVPQRVQQFIAQVELAGGAAKICGAGAVAGENAGVLLALVEDEKYLLKLCADMGYEVISIAGESRGVHVL